MRSWRVVVCVAAALIAFGACVCSAEEAQTFAVTGKVLLPEGKPAAGATVEARSTTRGADWKVAATAATGADGAFEMKLPKGDYLFYAASDSLVYLDRSEMTSVKADGKLSKPIELKLEKGCNVEGSVIDSATGQPVGGVKILSRDGDHAESDASGKWGMVVNKGGKAITAVKEGYYWPIVNFRSSDDTAKVKVEIRPGGTLKGRVLDEEGKPIPGAWVGTRNSGYFPSQHAKTDADGRFALPGLDPDAKLAVSASADGYDYLSDQPVTFAAGQREAQVEFTLKKTKRRTISGRVTKPDGSPIEGAKVAYGDGTHYVNYVSVKTDKDGKYEIKDAGVEASLVVVAGRWLAPVYKDVEADKDVTMDFVVKPGHGVKGRVEDEDGKPVAHALVSGSMLTKRDNRMSEDAYFLTDIYTDKDGSFRLDHLPEGEIYADVYADGYDSLDKERLKVDKDDYTLVLRKTVKGQIAGTVLRDSDGKPVTEFNVRLDFSRMGGSSNGIAPGLVEQGVSFQAADGRFAIKGLKVKDGYKLVVNAPGYMEGSVDPVMVKPVSESDFKDSVIRLKPSSSFEGSITAAGTGAPVEGVLVSAWNSSGSSGMYDWDISHSIFRSVSTRTDASGKFKFDSMPFTSGMVQLEKPGFARTIVKAVSFSRPFKAVLENGATVMGSIADEQGKVSPGTWLSLEEVDPNVRFVSSQSELGTDGSFKVVDLPPGDYHIGLYKEGSPVKHQMFELKPGETFHVDWVQKGDVTLQGKVSRNGKPLAGARVSANSEKPGMNWCGSAETGEDGSYKMTLIDPGRYFISCMIGDPRDAKSTYTGKTVPLSAGANKLDFKLPYGSLAGKLLDKATGKPLPGASIRLYVRETYEQHSGKSFLGLSDAEPRWWPESGDAKTDKNGEFRASDLKAGEWLVCLSRSPQSGGAVPAAIVKLADGQAKTGVVAKVAETGSAKVSFAGMKEPPKDALPICVDEFGMTHYPKLENGTYTPEYEDLPVGKAKAVVAGGSYLPAEVAFQVRPDEMTDVSIKLTKGPRIVFKPKSGSEDVKGTASIGFRITTPDGKPVYRTPQGLCWGGILTYGPERNDTPGITVKPGTYLVKAGARLGDSRNYGDDPELTGYSGKVTVVNGKDTVIEVPVK